MAINNFTITFDIEPLVKLYCLNLDCRFNLVNNRAAECAHCTLKFIGIEADGKCEMFEAKGTDVKEDLQNV